MKLSVKLVAVKKIASEVDKSRFSAEDIERYAELILTVHGTVSPLILERQGEVFKVVQGHFEYHAAARAREISPMEGEMIQAVILEPDTKGVLEQLEILKRIQ